MAKPLLHSTATGLQAAKTRCLACEAPNVEMSREHFWPQWLIERTNSKQTGVRWFGGKKISPSSATIPLCKSCNHTFGSELEGPVIKAFDSLEGGNGISDFEAELLVRWMWKFEGYGWLLHDNIRTYSHDSTLKDRVLNRLSSGRSEVSIAISLIDKIDSKFGDKPMGLDSENECNRVFVSGVFSKIAIIVGLTQFSGLLPNQFSVYTLDDSPNAATEHSRMHYPKVGFPDDIEAVGVTRMISQRLSKIHDDYAIYSSG